MPSHAKIGLLLMGLSFVGLFAEYIWREVVGRPTPMMILFWQAMMLPMMGGAFLFSEYFGWPVIIRVIVGVVSGYVLWKVVYPVIGAIYSIFK